MAMAAHRSTVVVSSNSQVVTPCMTNASGLPGGRRALAVLRDGGVDDEIVRHQKGLRSDIGSGIQLGLWCPQCQLSHSLLDKAYK